MKNKRNVLYSLTIMLAGVIYFPVQAQQKNGAIKSETKDVSTSYGPNGVVRAVIQDRKGNIWLASAEGIIRYDGKSFTNITGKVSSVRFSSVLEDGKGNFWFASVGSGVYYYDGTSLPTGQAGFQNYTTKDGLSSNRVNTIYEDKTGNIWFGTEEGASRYDGKSFKNINMKEGPPPSSNDSSQVAEVHWTHNDINAIIEDKTGKFWFGTKGDFSLYDARLPDGQGKRFTTISDKYGKAFANVRSMIEDKKGNIWLGGKDGLWRYDGSTFTNFTQNFVGYIYEDKNGNIWTSSESATARGWVLSRYDGKTLSNGKPTVTEIKPEDNKEIFGILEASDGSIWIGASNGVYRYDARLPDGQGNIFKRL